jgi:eukaryotic-like serine/threonine-protein kinase
MTGERSTPREGPVIAGKYNILRTIGEGGMGVVYEAVHLRLEQRVAVKMLNDDLRANADIVERFGREARTAAKLKSPHVARIMDVDVLADGTPFMVMEYLDGHDLGQELEDRGKLPVPEAVDLLLEACHAMVEAHRLGIVHRDLKPENLFLCSVPEGRTVKVLDFGISKAPPGAETNVTVTEVALGTPAYMSPEQIRSARKVDQRSDIWALGVILYECIHGENPFTQATAPAVIAAITADEPVALATVCPEVPAPLSAAVMRALQKRPDDRFADVDAFARAIVPFAGHTRWSPPEPRASGPGTWAREDIDDAATTDAPTLQSVPRAVARTQSSWTEGGARSRTTRARGGLVLGGVLVLAVAAVVVWRATIAAPTASPAAETTQAAAGTVAPPPAEELGSAAPEAPPPSVPAAASSGRPQPTAAPHGRLPATPTTVAPPPSASAPPAASNKGKPPPRL